MSRVRLNRKSLRKFRHQARVKRKRRRGAKEEGEAK